MRTLSRRSTALVIAAIAAVATVACSPPPAPNDQPSPAPAAAHLAGVLTVDNSTQYPDVDVYVARDGTVTHRLGQVTGSDVKSFALTEHDVAPGAMIAFYAHAIGDRGKYSYRSAEMPAQPGARYEWKLGVAGPGTEFLSQRADVSSLDAQPPNSTRLTAASIDSTADSTYDALRLRFGCASG